MALPGDSTDMDALFTHIAQTLGVSADDLNPHKFPDSVKNLYLGYTYITVQVDAGGLGDPIATKIARELVRILRSPSSSKKELQAATSTLAQFAKDDTLYPEVFVAEGAVPVVLDLLEKSDDSHVRVFCACTIGDLLCVPAARELFLSDDPQKEDTMIQSWARIMEVCCNAIVRPEQNLYIHLNAVRSLALFNKCPNKAQEQIVCRGIPPQFYASLVRLFTRLYQKQRDLSYLLYMAGRAMLYFSSFRHAELAAAGAVDAIRPFCYPPSTNVDPYESMVLEKRMAEGGDLHLRETGYMNLIAAMINFAIHRHAPESEIKRSLELILTDRFLGSPPIRSAFVAAFNLQLFWPMAQSDVGRPYFSNRRLLAILAEQINFGDSSHKYAVDVLTILREALRNAHVAAQFVACNGAVDSLIGVFIRQKKESRIFLAIFVVHSLISHSIWTDLVNRFNIHEILGQVIEKFIPSTKDLKLTCNAMQTLEILASKSILVARYVLDQLMPTLRKTLDTPNSYLLQSCLRLVIAVARYENKIDNLGRIFAQHKLVHALISIWSKPSLRNTAIANQLTELLVPLTTLMRYELMTTGANLLTRDFVHADAICPPLTTTTVFTIGYILGELDTATNEADIAKVNKFASNVVSAGTLQYAFGAFAKWRANKSAGWVRAMGATTHLLCCTRKHDNIRQILLESDIVPLAIESLIEEKMFAETHSALCCFACDPRGYKLIRDHGFHDKLLEAAQGSFYFPLAHILAQSVEDNDVEFFAKASRGSNEDEDGESALAMATVTSQASSLVLFDSNDDPAASRRIQSSGASASSSSRPSLESSVASRPSLQSNVASSSQKCWKCGKTGQPEAPLKYCNGCMKATYCSKECQQAHWPDHKHECKRMKKRLLKKGH